MVLKKTHRSRPIPNDFDPFIDDGDLRKVCVDCYDVLDISSFQREDGTYSGVCESCRAELDESGPSVREPFIGERIAEGFRLMGVDDEGD
jgi:hypothetical protein